MSLVPKLRFKEFSGEWEEKKLSSVGVITTGSTPSTSVSEYYNGERLFVSPADIQGNRYINNTKTTLTELGFTKGRKVVKGSVCFVCIGSTIGKVAQLTEDSLTNQQINCITANDKNINDFVYSLLELKAPRIKLLAGEQAVPQINKSDFSKLKFILPSKPEQEKTASFLTSVDTKIEQLTKKEELLKQYKKGVMQKIFSQEIRFKAEDGSEFDEWEEKKLGDVAYITTGKSNREDSGTEGHYTFFDRSEDIRTSDIYLFDKEAIIVAGEGSDFPPKHFKGKFDLHQRTYAIMDFVNAEAKYLFYYLHYYRSYFVRYAVGSTVKSLRLPIFQKMDIKLPCLEEQRKIANFLSLIDEKIEQVQKQLTQTKEFKKALLQQMFV